MEHIFGDPVGEIESIISDMKSGTTEQVYIDGVGWCREVTVMRRNENGVNEPYNIYEPVKE
jgi:hypothetical protein